MLTWTTPGKVEVAAYFALILGVLGDHLSTSVALAKQNVREANPVALGLMRQGLWNWADLALILVRILATYLVLRVARNPLSRLILLFPAIAGVVRLVVTVWNLALII